MDEIGLISSKPEEPTKITVVFHDGTERLITLGRKPVSVPANIKAIIHRAGVLANTGTIMITETDEG